MKKRNILKALIFSLVMAAACIVSNPAKQAERIAFAQEYEDGIVAYEEEDELEFDKGKGERPC